MKHKIRTQINLSKEQDAFAALSKVQKLTGVLSANVRDFRTLIVNYDQRKLNASDIAATVSHKQLTD